MNIFSSPQSPQPFPKELREEEAGENVGRAALTHLGTASPLFLLQVHPALSPKQCLEFGIIHVLHGDNKQLSTAQHLAKAQSRDILVHHCCPNPTGTSITV